MSYPDLSPASERVGRACAWIERADGHVLMTGLDWGGWTLPGGGIHPGETPEQAAVREAWEEAGVWGEVCGAPFPVDSGQTVCVPLRLTRLDASPEGRPVAWVNPRALPWAHDQQLREVLAGREQTPPHLALPPLVARAMQAGFPHSCSLETGRLLRTLAALRPGGQMLELGTGAGVGTAWLLAGLRPGGAVLTVEADPQRAQAAWHLLRSEPRARVICGDWAEVLTPGSADLIFADCRPAKQPAALEVLVAALNPGGLLVMDDLSPPSALPEALHSGDPLREAVFAHPRLSAAEVQVSRRECLLLATKTA